MLMPKEGSFYQGVVLFPQKARRIESVTYQVERKFLFVGRSRKSVTPMRGGETTKMRPISPQFQESRSPRGVQVVCSLVFDVALPRA